MLISSHLAGGKPTYRHLAETRAEVSKKKRGKGNGQLDRCFQQNPRDRLVQSWTSVELASQVLWLRGRKTVKPSPRCSVSNHNGVDPPTVFPYPALHRLMSLSKDSRGPDLFSERSTAALTINRAMWTSLSSRLANSQVGLKLRLADASKVHPSIFNRRFIQHSESCGCLAVNVGLQHEVSKLSQGENERQTCGHTHTCRHFGIVAN